MTGNRPGANGEGGQPGLAAERTALAWNRTALSFLGTGALAGRVLAGDALVVAVVATVVALGAAGLAWDHGRRSYGHRHGGRLAAPPPILIRAVALGPALLALVIAVATTTPRMG